ncbi:MAG: transcription antitermination factor NusB [Alphaproteobacteria bacterium]
MDYKKYTSSRLAAVQATYMMEYGMPVDEIVNLFENGSLGGEALIEDEDCGFEEVVPLVKMDNKLFERIARGTAFRFEELSNIVFSNLSRSWTKERIEKTVKAILLCGAYELSYETETPVQIIIDEYVGITSSFYNNAEVGLVNAVLDKIAKTARDF